MMLPLSFMRGAAELTVKKAPLRLVWTIFSKMASSVVPVGVLPEMPALAKTMSSLPKADQKFSDRAVMSAILVVFSGWFGFMAVDARRCGWSYTPLWVQVLGAALIVRAFYGWAGVLRANSFAAFTVRLQEERG